MSTEQIFKLHLVFLFLNYINAIKTSIIMAMTDNNKEEYNAVKLKPEKLLLFVDKHVRVQVIKKSSYMGFVHSIDPVTYSIILSVPQEDTFKTVLIPGHAILNITEEEPITTICPPLRRSLQSPEKDEACLKDKIIAWLKQNLLPASEDGDKILFGNASLLPPYGVSDICTDNPIVALQMRKLIEAMPKDFTVLKT